jgi:hypothetical protein
MFEEIRQLTAGLHKLRGRQDSDSISVVVDAEEPGQYGAGVIETQSLIEICDKQVVRRFRGEHVHTSMALASPSRGLTQTLAGAGY